MFDEKKPSGSRIITNHKLQIKATMHWQKEGARCKPGDRASGRAVG
jgi:hypothetical protein